MTAAATRGEHLSPLAPERKAVRKKWIMPAIRHATPRVLFAEDDAVRRRFLARALTRAGFDVTPCRDGRELIRNLGTSRTPPPGAIYDLIVLDLGASELTRLPFLARTGESADLPPVIVASGGSAAKRGLRDLRPAAVLKRPLEIATLLATMAHLLA